MDIISTNIYIIHEIFEYLNLKDLLIAAKVSTEFRNAVMEFLQFKYKEIQAFKTRHHYIVSNKVTEENDIRLLNNNKSTTVIPRRENRILLSYSEFLEFLNLNSNNIETLMLHYNDEYEVRLDHIYYEDRQYLSEFKFNKLKRLGFGEMSLTEVQLNNIIKNCSNLEEIYCCNLLDKDDNERIWIKEIPLKTLDNKKIIKCKGYVDLELIDGYGTHREEKFIYLEHLALELNSPTCGLNLEIENNTMEDNSEEMLNQLNYCEILIEGQCVNQRIFDQINQETFSNIVNLKSLTLVAAHYVNFSKEIFQAFNNKCKHLEYLRLEYCAIKEYIPINSLKELVLYYCFELKTKDLAVILSQHANLHTFTSTSTDYKGEYKLTKISQQLQKLKLRYNDIDYRTISSLDLKNITSLHWSNKVLTKQTWINGKNCPNLEILEVKTSHLLFMNIEEFKYLKKLILNVSEDLNTEDFWLVLQNTTLDYLGFHTNHEYNFMNYENYLRFIEGDDEKCKNVLNIKFMDICYMDNCKDYFNFWLTLLAKNFKLSLRIKYNCHRTEYDYDDDCSNVLSDIVNCESLPESLKTINVCGLNIEILDYLHPKDLMVLAKVSTLFCNAVIEHLKVKYKTVQAYKLHYDYIVSNNVAEDFELKSMQNSKLNIKLPKREKRILLSYEDFYEFINLMSNNIETLLLHYNVYYQYDLNGAYYNDKDYFSKIKFEQLKTMGFTGKFKITENVIDNAIKNCPNLKEIYCYGILPKNDGNDKDKDEEDDSLMALNTPDIMINIMKCLGYIDICLVNGSYSLKENDLIHEEHLLTELNASTYAVNMIKENTINLNKNNVRICKVLTQGQYINKSIFDEFNGKTLKNLIYLNKLIIASGCFTHLNREFFVNLNSFCKNLETLKLEFCIIKEFQPVDSIKELILYNSLGLTGDNLISMLSQQKNLKTFSSILSKYKGDYNKFNKISQQLENIELRYNVMDNSIMWLLDLKNLNSLHWSDKVSTKQNWINANNCPNLQILEVKSTHFIFESISGFTNLKKLILNVCKDLSDEEFWQILQHPSLIYLSFQSDPEYNFMNYENYLLAQIENINCWILDIRFIDVCFVYNYKGFFDFWLILLAKNTNLSLRIKYNCFHTEYIEEDDVDKDHCVDIVKDILDNPNRPKSLKTINICGLNVGVNELIEDFTYAIVAPSWVSEDNRINNKLQYILLENSGINN